MIKALLILIIFLSSGLMAETTEEFKARKRAGIERRKAERAAAAKENRAVKPIPVAPKKVKPKKEAPKRSAAVLKEMAALKYEGRQTKEKLLSASKNEYNYNYSYLKLSFSMAKVTSDSKRGLLTDRKIRERMESIKKSKEKNRISIRTHQLFIQNNIKKYRK